MARKANKRTSYGSMDSSLVRCSSCGDNYDSLDYDSCPKSECRANQSNEPKLPADVGRRRGYTTNRRR